MRAFLVVSTIAGALAVSSVVLATPPVGQARPAFTMVDAWERPLHLPSGATKPVLVIYEDKDSANQNVALKDELAQAAKDGKYKSRVILLAVADVSGYDYFPAKGFVISAIKSQSAAFGTPIYCDWTGAIRTTLRLEPKRSNVVLYGRDGKVALSYAGTLPVAKRKELLALLASLAGS